MNFWSKLCDSETNETETGKGCIMSAAWIDERQAKRHQQSPEVVPGDESGNHLIWLLLGVIH